MAVQGSSGGGGGGNGSAAGGDASLVVLTGQPALLGAAKQQEGLMVQEAKPGSGRRELLLNGVLARTLAAACLASFATGWLIGIWGGVSAMPAFAAAFFPETVAARAHTSADSGAGAARYCMFDDQLLSLGGSVIYIAALPALAVASRATRAFGRLATLWAITALLIAGAAVGAAAPATRAGLGAVFVGRALGGAAMGCSFQAPTMLLSEVLPRHLRGQGLFTHTLAMLLGFLVSAVANQLLQPFDWGWRASTGLLATPAVVLAALLPFVGESPQVLYQRGDVDGARKALAAVRPRGADTALELAQIAAAAERAAAHATARGAPVAAPPATEAAAAATACRPARRRGSQSLLANPPVVTASVLYPLTLMLSGLSILSGWTPNLLLAFGASSRLAYAGNTLMMAVGLAAACVATLFVDRLGRRLLLAAGASLIVSTLTLLAVLLAVYLPGTEGAPAPPAALLPLVVVVLCVNRAALSCTIQPLAVTVPAEVQPLAVRSQASALTTAVRNGTSFFFTQFALPMLCATRWGLFAMMACATAAGATALWLLVPETRGLALEEVHQTWHHHWFWGWLEQRRQQQHDEGQEERDSGTGEGKEVA